MLNSTYNFHQEDDFVDSALQVSTLQLPRMTSEHARLFNSWYGNGAPIVFPFQTSKVSIFPCYIQNQHPDTQLKFFSVICNHKKIVIGIELDCILSILKKTAGDIKIDQLSEQDLAVVAEFSCLPLIEHIEKTHNLSLAISPYTPASPEDSYTLLTSRIQFQGDSHSYDCTFSCLDSDLEYWASIFEQRPSETNISDDDLSISLPLILRYSPQEFTLGNLRNLNPSDVIILHSEQNNNIEICAGSYLFWFVRHTNNQLKIVSDDRLQNNIINNNTKNNWINIMSGSEDIASIDDIPVTASFEIGRKDVTVKELREFKDGTIISFPGTEDNQIKITVNGKEIGLGTLVQVDDCIGVKIDRVFVNG